MTLRPLRHALLTIPLLALSTACATRPDAPAVHVPAELARPPCRPPASLMVRPAPLPPLRPGDNMVETSARDTLRYNALRRQTIGLIEAVERCP